MLNADARILCISFSDRNIGLINFCFCESFCLFGLVWFLLFLKFLGRWKCSFLISTTFCYHFDINFQALIFAFPLGGLWNFYWIHTLLFEFQKCFQSFWVLHVCLSIHKLMIAKYLLLQVLKSVIELSWNDYSYKKKKNNPEMQLSAESVDFFFPCISSLPLQLFGLWS